MTKWMLAGKATMKATDKNYQKEVIDFLKPTSVKIEEAKKTVPANQYDKEIAVGAKAHKEIQKFVDKIKKSKVDSEAKALVAQAEKGIRAAMDILAKG